MESFTLEWILFVILISYMIFMASLVSLDPLSAANNSHNNYKNPIAEMGLSKHHNLITGVRILGIHTNPSTVHTGNTFKIMGYIINNSTATITFPNGTCNSSISLDFNKNVMIENQGIAQCTTTSKEIILKPHERSILPSTINSGIVYKAIAPGVTNATISFNYRVETANGKSPISDNISRVYTFNINNKTAAKNMKLMCVLF